MSNCVTVQHNCVVGLGCAGINALNTMVRQSIPGMFKSIAIDTDNKDINKSEADFRIEMDNIRDCSKIIAQLCGIRKMIIMAGLGGVYGSSALLVMVDISHSLGIDTHAVVTTPFNFEGPKRAAMANIIIRILRKHCHSIKILHNQHILSEVNEETTVKEAFLESDEMMIKVVKEIM